MRLRGKTISIPEVHSLLRISDIDALRWDADQPVWASASLRRAPWVVVRRAMPQPDMCPVGVRGVSRAERAAAWLPVDMILTCVTPRMLVQDRSWCANVAESTPAIAALDLVEGIFDEHGLGTRWGPGGSVGFELASGMPTTTSSSDLDIVFSCGEPMALTDAARLYEQLCLSAVRIDVVIETPCGGVTLADYARGRREVLLRSAAGPRLVRSPWSQATVGTE